MKARCHGSSLNGSPNLSPSPCTRFVSIHRQMTPPHEGGGGSGIGEAYLGVLGLGLVVAVGEATRVFFRFGFAGCGVGDASIQLL